MSESFRFTEFYITVFETTSFFEMYGKGYIERTESYKMDSDVRRVDDT